MKNFHNQILKQEILSNKMSENVDEGCKDFKCESCGKSFAQADSLKGHIKTVHKGDKDFKCESYGKPIIKANSLRGHTKTVHEGDKDFKWESCEKSFTQADSLREHMKIFTKVTNIYIDIHIS